MGEEFELMVGDTSVEAVPIAQPAGDEGLGDGVPSVALDILRLWKQAAMTALTWADMSNRLSMVIPRFLA